jgi:hypothetical protein
VLEAVYLTNNGGEPHATGRVPIWLFFAVLRRGQFFEELEVVWDGFHSILLRWMA